MQFCPIHVAACAVAVQLQAIALLAYFVCRIGQFLINMIQFGVDASLLQLLRFAQLCAQHLYMVAAL